MLTLHKFL